MYKGKNILITGASSGISTTLNGAITATATSLTLTSATGFEASNLSSRCYVKIGNEIMFGRGKNSFTVKFRRHLNDELRRRGIR